MTVEQAQNGQFEEVEISARMPSIIVDDQPVLGRIGSLETRLARNSHEIDAAQRVRYQVFVDEMKARLSSDCMARKRDNDAWDAICDHLLVLDRSIEGDTEDQIVGTYRILRQDVAIRRGGFYSASEFLVEDLLAQNPGKMFMELGRSCVLPAYRNKRTVELLWQGNWAYALKHRMDAMFGCASFPGTDPDEHALAFGFLHHTVLATGNWAVRARNELYEPMDRHAFDPADSRKALSGMPPLVKGYLRLGAMVGDGAVVDRAFNTTDVLIVLPIDRISDRYISHYGADAGRFSA